MLFLCDAPVQSSLHRIASIDTDASGGWIGRKTSQIEQRYHNPPSLGIYQAQLAVSQVDQFVLGAVR